MDRDKLVFRLDLQLFSDEKTEEATPKKRQDVRKKGQVAKSGEIGTALLILSGFYTIKLLLNFFIFRIESILVFILERSASWDGSLSYIYNIFLFVLSESLLTLLPIFGILVLVAIISQAIQVGIMFNPTILMPKFSRINPIEGFKRIFSKRAIVEFLKSLLKIIIIASLVYRQINQRIPSFISMSFYDIRHSFLIVSDGVFSLTLTVGFTLLILALLDYFYQRWEFRQNIKMSKQEVKEEYKQTEGDPQIRSRIRQKQREMASRRMMVAVPTADVIITNPTHFAIALVYESETMAAPEVVAKGAGTIALRIKEIGNENNIPTVENPHLARALYKSVEIGQQIPAELYPAVAEVLAFVYRLKKRRR